MGDKEKDYDRIAVWRQAFADSFEAGPPIDGDILSADGRVLEGAAKGTAAIRAVFADAALAEYDKRFSNDGEG